MLTVLAAHSPYVRMAAHLVASPHIKELHSIRLQPPVRHANINSIQQYFEWPISGALCSLLVIYHHSSLLHHLFARSRSHVLCK